MRDFEEAIRDRMGGVQQPDSPLDAGDRRALNEQVGRTLGTSLVNTSVITNRGFEEIGTDTDASRTVFRRGDIVVKFDHIGLDPWKNENEAVNWEERLPRDALDLFAPIVDRADDYGWVAMQYADTDNVPDEGYRQLLRELIVDHNLDMTDPHPDNVGVLDGRVVLIDYNFRPKEAGETPAEREALYETKLRNYGVEP